MHIVNSIITVNNITEVLTKLQNENLTNKPYMKNLIKLFTLLTFTGFILTSCEGPMGEPGKDANESCLMCHNNDKMAAIEAQYEMSDKGERTARSGKYCAKCHSTEGFKEVVTMGTFNTTNEMLNGTKLTCAACHKHSSFDFSVDTITQVLRTVAPIYSSWDNFDMATLAYKRTYPTDYENTNNLCANCHQYRGTRYPLYSDLTPPIIPPATVSVAVKDVKFTEVPYFPIKNISSNENTLVKYRAGTNFGLHEGANQADYLTSKNGYEYTGKTYTRTTAHSSSTCTDCHFNTYDDATKTGGHTMKVNLTDPKCTTCHDIAARRTITLAAIEGKLIQLGDLLAARKVFKKSGTSYSAQFSHDFYGTVLPTTTSATTFALTVAAANTVSPTTGLMLYNNTVAWAANTDYANRIGREWKYGELGAAWNFTYVNTVATTANKGVHNPTYAMELLNTSIEWLTNNP
jgi:pterin-4a-carbinolamine dehydratase